MNQIFSFKRYAWLMKRQFVENAAIYKWGIVAMAALIPVFFCLFGNWSTPTSFPSLNQSETLIIGSFVLLIYSGNFFDSIGSKYKGMYYFTLPVSPLERVAVTFTYTMILFPALFLLMFSCFDYFAILIFKSIHHINEEMVLFTNTVTWEGIYIYIVLISALTLGSFMFGKNGVIKTGILLFLLVLFFFGLQSLIYKSILPFNFSTTFPDQIRIDDKGYYYLSINNIFISAWYLVAPLIWIILYFKLKEKEI
jgi:hypothetical protein